MTEEGWYSDPFRRHEHRWLSDGTPKLWCGIRVQHRETPAGRTLFGATPANRGSNLPGSLYSSVLHLRHR